MYKASFTLLMQMIGAHIKSRREGMLFSDPKSPDFGPKILFCNGTLIFVTVCSPRHRLSATHANDWHTDHGEEEGGDGSLSRRPLSKLIRQFSTFALFTNLPLFPDPTTTWLPQSKVRYHNWSLFVINFQDKPFSLQSVSILWLPFLLATIKGQILQLKSICKFFIFDLFHLTHRTIWLPQ